MKENILVDKSFQFALEIIKLYKILNKQNEFVISRQILKSGTSIGANIEEAQQAQSKPDFISKLSIALKEAQETHYWLRLLKESKIIEINVSDYLTNTEELIRLLTSIIISSKRKKD